MRLKISNDLNEHHSSNAFVSLMRASLKSVLVATAVILSAPVGATSMGDIRSEPLMYRNLEAEIPVEGIRIRDAADVVATIDFERSKNLPVPLSLEVLPDPATRGVKLRVVSRGKIAEPLITLNVSIEYDGSVITREYVLLPELPAGVVTQAAPSRSAGPSVNISSPTQSVASLPAAAPAPVRPAPVAAPAAEPVAEPVAATPTQTSAVARRVAVTKPAPQSRPIPIRNASKPVAVVIRDPIAAAPTVSARAPIAESVSVSGDGSSYGPIRAKQTLSGIAESLRSRYPETTIQQRMQALMVLNPQAFVPGTLMLNLGAQLQLPTVASVNALSADDSLIALRAGYRGQLPAYQPTVAARRVAATVQPVLSTAVDSPAVVPAVSPGSPVTAQQVASGLTFEDGLYSRAYVNPTAVGTAVEVRRYQMEAVFYSFRLMRELGEIYQPVQSATVNDGAVTSITPVETTATTSLPAVVGQQVDQPIATTPAATVAPSVTSEYQARPYTETSAVDEWAPIEAPSSPSLYQGVFFLVIGLFGAIGGLLGIIFLLKRADYNEPGSAARKARNSAASAISVAQGSHGVEPLLAREATNSQSPSADKRPVSADDLRGRPMSSDDSDFVITESEQDMHSVQLVDINDPVEEARLHAAFGIVDEAIDVLRRAVGTHITRGEFHIRVLKLYFRLQMKDEFLEQANAIRLELEDGGEVSEVDRQVWRAAARLGQKLMPEIRLFKTDLTGEKLVFEDLDDLTLSNHKEPLLAGTNLGLILEGMASADSGTSMDESAVEAQLPSENEVVEQQTSIEDLELGSLDFDLSDEGTPVEGVGLHDDLENFDDLLMGDEDIGVEFNDESVVGEDSYSIDFPEELLGGSDENASVDFDLDGLDGIESPSSKDSEERRESPVIQFPKRGNHRKS